MVGLVAECRIGEVHVSGFANDDIVRRVESLAFPLIGQYLDSAFLVGTGDAAGAGFAGVQTAFTIEGVAAGAIGFLAQNFDLLARNPFQKLITLGIAEDQIPDRKSVV